MLHLLYNPHHFESLSRKKLRNLIRVQKANNGIIWLTDVKSDESSDSRSSLSSSVSFFFVVVVFSFTASNNPVFKPQCIISIPGEAAGNSTAVPEQALQY